MLEYKVQRRWRRDEAGDVARTGLSKTLYAIKIFLNFSLGTDKFYVGSSTIRFASQIKPANIVEDGLEGDQ